jgi:hypothetical protein
LDKWRFFWSHTALGWRDGSDNRSQHARTVQTAQLRRQSNMHYARSAWVSYAWNFVALGLLPAPVRGLSDITELYVARFGVPKVGTRVFIRTRQQINGWKDAPKQTNAIVPKP